MIGSPTPAAKACAITPARLKSFAWTCDAEVLAPELEAAAAAHGIAAPRPLRHWLAQLAVESAGLTRFAEDLDYSAQRLRIVWPERFPTLYAALAVAHRPEALAAAVYVDRNGNRGPADAWAYRGRGLIQLTGRTTYADAGRRLGQPYATEPDLVASPRHAALTAADFWVARGCDKALTEHPDDREACIVIRRLINGGETDLAAAQSALARATAIWS